MILSSSFKKHSPEWIEIKHLMQERKKELTRILISKNDDEVRGRIKELEEFLALDKDSSQALEPVPLEY